MTPGIMNGKLLRLYIDGVAQAKATECSVSFTAETREASHKDSGGWKESLPGMKSASLSSSGLHAEDSTNTVHDLYAAWLAGTPIAASFSTEVVGDKFYSGLFVITQLELNAPNEENVTWSVSLESAGAITLGTH